MGPHTVRIFEAHDTWFTPVWPSTEIKIHGYVSGQKRKPVVGFYSRDVIFKLSDDTCLE